MEKYSNLHGRGDVFQHLSEEYVEARYNEMLAQGMSEDDAFDELWAEDCALDEEGD